MMSMMLLTWKVIFADASHLRWACARPRLLGVCLGRAVGCFSLASTGIFFEEF